MTEREKTIGYLAGLKAVRNDGACWCTVASDFHSWECVRINDLYTELLNRVEAIDDKAGRKGNAAGRAIEIIREARKAR